MIKTSKNKQFEDNIKNILREKFTGFKRFGAGTGALLGSGAGGTKGLMDAIKADDAGEMENMDKLDKTKAYLEHMLVPGLAGMGIGAGVGLAGGEGLRRLRTNQTFKGLSNEAKNIIKQEGLDSDAYEPILEDMSRNFNEKNVFSHIKEKLFGKKSK
jgi:hypothetical protein